MEWDWDAVQAEAERLGCRRMLWLGVSLACELLDAPLPDKVRRDLRSDPVVMLLARRIQAQWFASVVRPFRWLPQLRFYLAACNSISQRVRFTLRTP